MDNNNKPCIGCKFAALDCIGYCCAAMCADIPYAEPVPLCEDVYDEDITVDMLPDDCSAAEEFEAIIDRQSYNMVESIHVGSKVGYYASKHMVMLAIHAMDMLIEEFADDAK